MFMDVARPLQNSKKKSNEIEFKILSDSPNIYLHIARLLDVSLPFKQNINEQILMKVGKVMLLFVNHSQVMIIPIPYFFYLNSIKNVTYVMGSGYEEKIKNI